jgi:hypothetical protein
MNQDIELMKSFYGQARTDEIHHKNRAQIMRQVLDKNKHRSFIKDMETHSDSPLIGMGKIKYSSTLLWARETYLV